MQEQREHMDQRHQSDASDGNARLSERSDRITNVFPSAAHDEAPLPRLEPSSHARSAIQPIER